ncbi:alpha-ketoglutarate-dependent dioxygenase alkB homolog 6 isoform X1 [Octopus bimaculoides]|uniref:Fe2OG dioxygenase domain-containing protein n=2 Tax=Octopus bimaculoides TaxID=37653 RepID=A0A0L8GFF1_OCTBM|nr:alpha-ketoglutarate-dependent dioxygenase alkB homolog 6 isoform X1 [Octopus bimaculoides]|eukprot:XP_014781476.1 PREDICTED: alpha-ketoglutarate-dependent dioxygenase alkB homolog 6-like [Octopus bimaculoides]
MDLEDYRVIKAPPTIIYVPNFITKENEEYLLKNIYSAPKPKWTQLSHRRLQNWGGLPHPKGMVIESLPQWLQPSINELEKLNIFEDKKPNHVLVNEYQTGQGIMPHEDGPLFYPTVATISLSSPILLDFYHHMNSTTENNAENNESDTSLQERHFLSLLLEPRSLIIVKDSMYTNHLHGISERAEDIITDKISNLDKCSDVKVGDVLRRTTRLSLTIRYVPKIIKTKFFLK